jgi:hypothetical protein
MSGIPGRFILILIPELVGAPKCTAFEAWLCKKGKHVSVI